DERDTVAAARLLLQPVAAALMLAAQIDDRADALTCQRLDIARRRLCRPPRVLAEAMPVDVQQPEDPVIDEQHVEVRGRRPEPGSRPVRAALDDGVSA